MSKALPEKARISEPRISIIRTVLGWVVGVSWTVFMAVVALVTSWFTRSGDIIHGYSRIWSRFLLWLGGVKVDVKGLENIPTDHPVLVVSNHQSLCDILVFSGFVPLQFRWIAKKELFKIPFLGPAMKKAGYIAIDRKNRESAYRSLKTAAEKLKHRSILIFPEGTRSRTGKLGKFKQGAAHLARLSKAPILPVTITNSFERLPPTKRGVVPGTIHVTIDPEIPTENLDKHQISALMEELHDRMERRIEASQVVSG